MAAQLQGLVFAAWRGHCEASEPVRSHGPEKRRELFLGQPGGFQGWSVVEWVLKPQANPMSAVGWAEEGDTHAPPARGGKPAGRKNLQVVAVWHQCSVGKRAGL